MSDIVFMDTETLGVGINCPIWEFAAIRRNGVTGEETELRMLIWHQVEPWLSRMKEDGAEFAADYEARWCDAEAVTPREAAHAIVKFFGGQPQLWAPPQKSDALSLAIGVDPAQFDRHTAMGDVLCVRAQYDAIMGGGVE